MGAGFYKEASLTVAIVLIGIEAIPPLMTKFGPKRLRSKELFLKVLVHDTVSITKVYEYLEKNGAYIEGILIRDIILENDYAKHEMEMRLSILTNETPVEFYNTLKQLDFIERVEVESI